MRLLARALEGDTVDMLNASSPAEEKTIVMTGPLSAIYAKALDIAYAKPEHAMESQQMDVAIMQKLAASMQTTVPPTNNFQTVYGVSRDSVTAEILIDITKEVANASPGDFFLIIDGTQPGANGDSNSVPQETMRQIGALECLVESHGGKVFGSLAEFAKSR